MKIRLAAVAALAATFFTSSLIGAQVPRMAAEFVIASPDGKTKQPLSSFKGKTVVLAFMFTTCDHCQKTAGVLAQVQKEYAAKGVQVLGVAFDQMADINLPDFIRTYGVNFPCGLSDLKKVMDFLELTEPPFVPDIAFIDKTGMVRAQYVGDAQFLTNQEVNIRAELDKMLKAGK